jgi:hypothetical protein
MRIFVWNKERIAREAKALEINRRQKWRCSYAMIGKYRTHSLDTEATISHDGEEA